MTKVSVVMSCYNSDVDILKNSVNSILNQTYKDFEFLIIDDGSTNKNVSKEIYKLRYLDNRIKIFQNEYNEGLTKSLNFVIRASIGQFIVRNDDDDFSLPNRIEMQINYLENNSEISVVGTNARVILKYKKNYEYLTKLPLDNSHIAKVIIYKNPILHSSACIRSEAIKKFYYNEKYINAQDYALWIRMINSGLKLNNLKECLIIINKAEPVKFKNFIYEFKVKINNFKGTKKILIYLHSLYILSKVIFNSILYKFK